MKELAIYKLEVAICLMAFSMLYFLFWQKETNFLFKRFLLISIPLLSMIIPLLDFNITMAKEQPILEYMVYVPNQVTMMQSEMVFAPQPETISFWQVIAIAWMLGAFFMLLRLGVSLWKIWKINQQVESSMDGKYKLVDDPIHSFSFFNLIVINKSQAESNAKEHILAHELAHSRQGHSFDVVFFELIKIIQWFNPFIWILAHLSKQNLEFLADQNAFTSTNNKVGYQYAIVHHAANSGYQLLKTQFSKTNLKNRIKMMNRPNNHKIASWKLFAVIPILTILLMSFSLKIDNQELKIELSEIVPVMLEKLPQTNISQAGNLPEKLNIEKTISKSPEHLSNYKPKTFPADSASMEVVTTVEDPPKPSTGDMASYQKEIYKNLRYPAVAKENGIEGWVFVEFIVRKDGSVNDANVVKGISPECDAEAERVVHNGPKWIPGKRKGAAVNVTVVIPIKFKLEAPTYSQILRGVVKTEDGKPVIGCNVIIKGTTTGTVSDNEGRFLIKVKPEHSELVFSYVGLISETVPITRDTDYNIILSDDPEYTGSASSTLKSNKVVIGGPIYLSNGITIRGVDSINPRPLYIIDGKEMVEYEMANIDPNDIESISVLKNEAAIAIYGDKGVNGVILINTKKDAVIENSIDSEILVNGYANQNEPAYIDVTIIDDNNKDGLKLRTDGNLDFGQDNPPTYFIDGVEITQKEVEKLNPNAIESIHVIKGKAAKDKYSKKGKNGVILIKMKK